MGKLLSRCALCIHWPASIGVVAACGVGAVAVTHCIFKRRWSMQVCAIVDRILERVGSGAFGHAENLAAPRQCDKSRASRELEERLTVKALCGRGISLRKILEIWHIAVEKQAVDENCTTGEFAHKVLIPLTAESGASYVEFISSVKGAATQPAQFHVVHSWRLNFRNVLVALARFINEDHSLSPSQAELIDIAWHEKHRPSNLDKTFFFCPFSVNQHSLLNKPSGHPQCEIDKFDKVTLEVCLTSQNPMVVVLDAGCQTLTRSCCLLELHAAIVNKIKIRYVGTGCASFSGAIDASKAAAWDIGTQRAILKKIESLGIKEFNKIVAEHVKQYAQTNLETIKNLVTQDIDWGPQRPVVDAKKFLVIGQCGDGKSTLVDHFRNPLKTKQPRMGRNPNGVTKQIQEYECKNIGGERIIFLDTPGVGDQNVKPMELISLLEQQLTGRAAATSGEVDYAPGVHGILVTNKVRDLRMTLGATVVQAMVEKGIVHGCDEEEQWKNVVLVGTMSDLSTPQEHKCFSEDTEEVWEEDGQQRREVVPSLASVFFRASPRKTGTAVTVSQNDYSDLERAISQMPSMRIKYQTPSSLEMAQALAEHLGMKEEDFEDKLKAEREKLIQELQTQVNHMRHGHQAVLDKVLLAVNAQHLPLTASAVNPREARRLLRKARRDKTKFDSEPVEIRSSPPTV